MAGKPSCTPGMWTGRTSAPLATHPSAWFRTWPGSPGASTRAIRAWSGDLRIPGASVALDLALSALHAHGQAEHVTQSRANAKGNERDRHETK